jgi:hypothetical protein
MNILLTPKGEVYEKETEAKQSGQQHHFTSFAV